MSSQAHKELHRRYFEDLFGQGRLDVADEIVAVDYYNHDTIPGELPGVGDSNNGLLACARRSLIFISQLTTRWQKGIRLQHASRSPARIKRSSLAFLLPESRSR